MPYRRIKFTENVYYHICNRSVGSEKIFLNPLSLTRALELINFYKHESDIGFSHLSQLAPEIRAVRLNQIYNSPKRVEFLAFSLMPTHFHFVLRQLIDDGIITFLTNFQNAYAKYYNIKFERHGSVFTNRFKAVIIESEAQLLHVIRYVELNPVSDRLIEINDLIDYPCTSFTTYMGKIIHPFINTEMILSYFKKTETYKQFVYNNADYQRQLQDIKNLLLE
ncbi:hypothetical protein A3C23_05570 [Candidatus Roizmanbacteria bacterium RIFCSPHIGHO2_02_FULL_37_13b]|uniref:Transposase IS200-like domain-containing protein n=1 Tax=Candidatus Roizmanbacteria bacterium RIFCSPLOWO2_02_FULL_36_11 TaxID=1802071 RepID=A0A1F7JCF1_9BACT|nr:MAG: hypothetical protein A3C23_05570 [Candidatus Roizmanbacteria bacterium RIFCSPHIGHO2_02_FULL_37_13b]OGK53290.1 MAG: hypothetical protein A3H78_03220 [Candidatus Roizmanbacteria bacterium RIFCSPLOWO2_02_FULL_36_11]